MNIHVYGIGVVGPGLNGWTETSEILTHRKSYCYQEWAVQSSALLPRNERRRCNTMTFATIQVAKEAMDHANIPYDSVATIYTSSEGSADAIDYICKSIAKEDFPISPTQFQNSVFNAVPGYWAIASKTNEPSISICCYDDSFAAGLLEATAQVVVENRMVLLISADQRLPEPLHSKRPIPDSFACAILVGPNKLADGPAFQISFNGNSNQETQMEDDQLERLRQSIPAARALPLFEAIASRQRKKVILNASPHSRILLEIGDW